jgi:hypothetical protein
MIEIIKLAPVLILSVVLLVVLPAGFLWVLIDGFRTGVMRGQYGAKIPCATNPYAFWFIAIFYSIILAFCGGFDAWIAVHIFPLM